MCVFLLSNFSLVAVNKAFYCGAVSADADTESGRGVPVPGPNPQTHRPTAEEDKVERGLCVPSQRLHLRLVLLRSCSSGVCRADSQRRDEEVGDL